MFYLDKGNVGKKRKGEKYGLIQKIVKLPRCKKKKKLTYETMNGIMQR